VATRRHGHEARRGELDARRVKLIPDSLASFTTLGPLVTPFVDAAANGNMAAVSDVAAVGDVAPLGDGAFRDAAPYPVCRRDGQWRHGSR